MRLLQQGHHQRTGRGAEGRPRGGIHVIVASLIEGEELFDFEKPAGFEKCLVQAAIPLVEAPGRGLAQPHHQPWQHEEWGF